MNDIIVSGSLGAIAQTSGKSIAETFVGADAIVLIDTSGSMASTDSRGGLSRYEVAKDELAALQNHLPGRVAVIAFSSNVLFVPSGIPPFLGGGTDVAGALDFARVADLPGMRFILISDGEPDDPADALRAASRFQNHIDVIYVGSEVNPHGRDFLSRLAKASGGSIITAERAQNLLQAAEHFLLGNGG